MKYKFEDLFYSIKRGQFDIKIKRLDKDEIVYIRLNADIASCGPKLFEFYPEDSEKFYGYEYEEKRRKYEEFFEWYIKKFPEMVEKEDWYGDIYYVLKKRNPKSFVNFLASIGDEDPKWSIGYLVERAIQKGDNRRICPDYLEMIFGEIESKYKYFLKANDIDKFEWFIRNGGDYEIDGPYESNSAGGVNGYYIENNIGKMLLGIINGYDGGYIDVYNEPKLKKYLFDKTRIFIHTFTLSKQFENRYGESLFAISENRFFEILKKINHSKENL